MPPLGNHLDVVGGGPPTARWNPPERPALTLFGGLPEPLRTLTALGDQLCYKRCSVVGWLGSHADQIEAMFFVDLAVQRTKPERVGVGDPAHRSRPDEPEGLEEEHRGSN